MSRRHTSRQSNSFAKRRRIKALLLPFAVVILCAVILLLISWAVNMKALSISTIRIAGADDDIAQSLQAAAVSALQGDYLHLFSKSSTLIYPRAAVAQEVASASPRVSSVSVSRDGLTALVVTVNERAPAALVCAGLPDFDGDQLATDQDTDCYFADSTGYIFEAAPTFSGPAYVRYYAPDLSDGTGSSSTARGQYATSTAEFQALQSMVASIQVAGIAVEGVLIKDGGEYELYASSPAQGVAGDTVVVYLDDLSPLESQAADLVSFWRNAASDAASKGQAESFDYIDVRYGDNVFYRESK